MEVLVLGATRRIRLTLISDQFTDTFKSLCQDLLRFTRDFDVGTSVDPLRVVILRLLHWHELLRSLHSTLLSKTEIVGLMGELFFLRDVFARKLPPVSAINSWCGPYKDEQDFSINGNIFEIKTSTVTVDSLLQISSEHQLDTSSGNICLVHQKIDSAEPSNVDSRSLNQLVAEMRDWAASRDHVACELLAAALTHAGWQERAEYDEARWVFASRKYYPVIADFPRIVPDLVMRGVERIRYSIRVDEIAEFCRHESDVLREYFHDDR